MEHDQLVGEMGQIERLTTAERLRLARKRRGLQLKRWAQREREYNLKRKGSGQDGSQDGEDGSRVHFVSAIMLLEAAARNDIEEVRRLLSLDVSPDSTNEDGLTALHQCCIDDSEEMMKVLVEFGADVNAADSEQWTPLHAAATCGHLHLVKFLIEKEASLLAVNGDGNMPYDICEDETTLSFIENEMAKRGVTQDLIDETRSRTETQMLADLMQVASQHGDLEWRDKHRATPLHIAAANGYLSVLEFLLDNHCSTEVCDLDLWQPLHAAACWGHLEAVEILAQNGADISAVTRSGETPFDITEDPEIKERLVELAEQRLRLSEPRVRRGRSSSTRTHSIRRTSLRDKMKTTKKDVADEGLIYMQGVSRTTDDDIEVNPSTDVVDLKDVHISLPPYKPVGLVSPMTKETNGNSFNGDTAPPIRPVRTNQDRRQSSFDDSPISGLSPVITSSLSQPGNGSPGDPINIHVSVTINPGPGLGQNTSYTSPSGTLADLKRTRSQNRVVGSCASSLNTSNQSLSSQNELDGITMNPNQGSGHSSNSSASSRRNPEVVLNPRAVEDREPKVRAAVVTQPSNNSPNNNRKKFAASSVEVVGPPAKTGCCTIV